MRSVLVAAVTLAMSSAAFAQELSWSDLGVAKKSGKPIVYLRILGELDGRL